MPHDQNGAELVPGDTVMVPMRVTEVMQTDDGLYCNCNLETLYPMPPYEHPSRMTLNTRQAVLLAHESERERAERTILDGVTRYIEKKPDLVGVRSSGIFPGKLPTENGGPPGPRPVAEITVDAAPEVISVMIDNVRDTMTEVLQEIDDEEDDEEA